MTGTAAPDLPALVSGGRLEAFRHWARRVTLSSVFANALFGIWAVAGPLDDIGAAALATSLLLTAAGVTSVACSSAIPERRMWVWIPLAGIAASLLGYALLIGAAWTDFETAPLWRLGGTLVAVAVAVAYASLMSGIRLRGRYRRLRWAAYVLVTGGAVFMTAFLWGYEPGQGWRLFGMLAVLLGAITIAAPVVQHLRPAEAGAPQIRSCPYCGDPIRSGGTTSRCDACGRRFRVTEV